MTRGGNAKPGAGATPKTSVSPSPSPSPSPVAGTYEVVGVGKCLNVRDQPSTLATRIDCVPNSFRLRTDGKTQTAEGRLWRRVYDKLTKTWGWAADQYLKRV
jgi:hypothetical protein